MPRNRQLSAVLFLSALAAVVGCSRGQRAIADSAAGAVGENVRPALSVIDIEVGKHVDSNQMVTERSDEFASTDTIYASVHTAGGSDSGAVVGRWTFEDGTLIDQKTASVTTSGDAHTVFYLANPRGFTKGKYTLHVLVGDREVRTKDVTVM